MDIRQIIHVCVYLLSAAFFCSGQTFTTDPVSLYVMKGTDITLFCAVDSLGAASLFWLHDGSVLSLNHIIVGGPAERLSIRGRYSLHIKDVQPEDEGEYECQVGTRPPLHQTSYLRITVPPKVTLSNNTGEIEAALGDDVTFHCSATGKPTPNITWSRQDMNLPDGTEYLMSDVITLSDLQYDHGGVYQCTAFNGVGEADKDGIKLNVYYAPIMHTKEGVVYTGPDQHATIPCLVSAQPQPLVTWTHNGSRVNLRDPAQRAQIQQKDDGFKVDYSLVIKDVVDSDFGSYTCTVKNDKGTASVGHTVTAIPSAVVITSSSKGDYSTEFDIHWNVTAVVVPTSYRLQFRKFNDNGSHEWKVVDITAEQEAGSEHHTQSYRLTGLSPNTKYEMSMRAANRYGWGEVGETFVFTTNSPGFTPPPTTKRPISHKHNIERDVYDKNVGSTLFPWIPLIFAIVFSTIIKNFV